jgi:hypothetical protein
MELNLNNYHLKDGVHSIMYPKGILRNSSIVCLLDGLGHDIKTIPRGKDPYEWLQEEGRFDTLKDCLDIFLSQETTSVADLDGNFHNAAATFSIITPDIAIETKDLSPIAPVFMFSNREGVPFQFVVEKGLLDIDISESPLELKEVLVIVLWKNILILSLEEEDMFLLAGAFYDVNRRMAKFATTQERFQQLSKPTAGEAAFRGIGGMYRLLKDKYGDLSKVVLSTRADTPKPPEPGEEAELPDEEDE